MDFFIGYIIFDMSLEDFERVQAQVFVLTGLFSNRQHVRINNEEVIFGPSGTGSLNSDSSSCLDRCS